MSLGVLLVLDGKRDQDLVDRHATYWLRHDEAIFILCPDQCVPTVPTTTTQERTKRGAKDIVFLAYTGGYEDIFDALINDDQLKNFQQFIIYTPDSFSLDYTNKSTFIISNSKEATIYTIGSHGNKHCHYLLWNREAITAVAEQVFKNLPTPEISWTNVCAQALNAAKVTMKPIGNSTHFQQNALEAATMIAEQGATWLAGINGPASLSFALNAKQCLSKKIIIQETKSGGGEVARVLKVVGGNNGAGAMDGGLIRPSSVVGMGGEDVTFVTALFDIRSREAQTPEKKACKTAADYLRLGSKLLEWDVNLFVMVEPEMVADVYRFREKLGLRNKTYVYPLTIESSRYYPMIAKLQALYTAGKIPKQYWAPKDTPLYVWCMMQKADALRRAMDINLFSSRKFYWIDYGIHHVAEAPKPNLDALLSNIAAAEHNRLRCTALRPLYPAEMANGSHFYGQLQQCIAGGFFGGLTSAVRWFVEEWEKEMDEAIKLYPALDQAMFARIWAKFPERFLLINGHYDGHRRLLHTRSNSEIVNEIKSAIQSKNWNLADAWTSELFPRPWSNQNSNSWTDKSAQLEALQLVAQIDRAKTNALSPLVAAALHPPSSSSSSSATAMVKSEETGKEKEIEMDGEGVGRMVERMMGWKRLCEERPEVGCQQVDRIRGFIADYGKRKVVIERLPMVNAMLELLASARLCSNVVDKTPLRRLPVWVINMDRRADRWKQMQQMVGMLGSERYRLFSEFRRWPAIEGANPASWELLKKMPFWDKISMLPAGAVAIFAVHYLIWKEWSERPTQPGESEWMLVLEDDAIFGPSFLRDMSGLQHLMDVGNGKALSQAYDVIWPGYHHHLAERWNAMSSSDPVKLIPLKENWITQGIGGMFGYFISKSGARLSVDLANKGHNHKPKEPIDEWFMRRIHDKVKHISTSKPIILSSFMIPGQPYDGDISGTPPIPPTTKTNK